MIKVIAGHKVKKDADIQPTLFKLRSHAMQYPGYVGAENLLGEGDTSIVVLVTTWERIDDWRVWGKSKIKEGIYRQAEALLEEEPKVTIYRVVPVQGWA